MSDLVFLHDATREQLEEAVAWNHRDWMIRIALAAGREFREAEGVIWTCSGPEGDADILFPRIPEDQVGERLDSIIQYYCERRPTAKKLAGCWSLDPPHSPDLGVRLLARGFQPGWRPCWMALDFRRLNADHPRPEGLKVAIFDDETALDVDDLPYYRRDLASVRRAAATREPRRIWHFVGWIDGRPVGHCSIGLTTGHLGVAGIYDMGVVPDARNRGIAKAVLSVACEHARTMGCGYATLNATGERMYNQVGFEKFGEGRTWWLNVPRLVARPPSRHEIELAEAVGRGDLDALSILAGRMSPEELDVPLTNELTLAQLAVTLEQPASVEWLVEHGADLDVISAWDLGWKERVRQMLAEKPEKVNKRFGEWRITALHEAVYRKDLELARVILAARPDLEIKDTEFQSTPLGWANHFGHSEIARAIERHQSGRAANLIGPTGRHSSRRLARRPSITCQPSASNAMPNSAPITIAAGVNAAQVPERPKKRSARRLEQLLVTA